MRTIPRSGRPATAAWPGSARLKAWRYWVLHVDLDQFIAAVEVLRHPELRGRPVVVGGDGDPAKRGVVATASYEARAHGVHSGLPLRTALRRCPDAVFLPVDKTAYEAVSATVMAALREFDAVVEVMGWDEAFLGVETEDPEDVARRIQKQVRAVSQLDCTVGIGENKLQAKLATGYGKPAGMFRLTHGSWFEVLGGQPTEALWGIGRKTAAKLAALGIGTVAELAATDPFALAPRLRPGDRPVAGPDRPRAEPVAGGQRALRGPLPRPETTFQQDISDWDAGARRGGAAGPPGRRRHRGRAAASGPRRGEGAVRAVLHPDPRPSARRADHRCRADRAGRPRGA